MTPLERTLCTLGHREPDRVPVFLLPTMHGAALLGVSLREYFSRAELVVEGQLRLLEAIGHDCAYAFRYAAIEAEAFGGDVIFADDGPANAGAPVLRSRDDLLALDVPDVSASPALQTSLEVVAGLAERVGGRVPVIGVVLGPASLPVMLLGFERYLVLLHEDPVAIGHLLEVTRRFATAWGRAQLAAGATAITLFDPLASSDVTSSALFERWVLPHTRRVLADLGGPAALHLASGRVGPRLDALADSGAAVLSVSAHDDLAQVKARSAGRIALLGNLNGVQMIGWDQARAAAAVHEVLDVAAPGGGFILADNHGEIPLQVPLDILQAITETARTWRGPGA